MAAMAAHGSAVVAGQVGVATHKIQARRVVAELLVKVLLAVQHQAQMLAAEVALASQATQMDNVRVAMA